MPCSSKNGSTRSFQNLRRSDCRLAVVELGEDHLGVGIDEGLLIDAAHALHVADIERVLGAAITGTFALELAVDLLLGLGFLQRHDLSFGEDKALLRHPDFERFSRVLVFARSWRNQTARTPNGEIDKPCFFSSLETRTWPQVGCSIASATTASISGATRFLRIDLLRLISASATSPPLS
jgi:hypothetical protein